MSPTESDRMVSREEIRAVFDITPQTVRNWLASGRLPKRETLHLWRT